MQVKSIAECSPWSILQFFRPSLSFHLSLRSVFCLYLSDRLRQVLLYILRVIATTPSPTTKTTPKQHNVFNVYMYISPKINYVLTNSAHPDEMPHFIWVVTACHAGAQWLSDRVLDSRPRGRGFEPHRRHCVVSLSKNINPSLVLAQPRKTRPFITERLLMGRKD